MIPLPQKLKPKKLEDVVGQNHLIGDGRALKALIENDNLSSAIFYGPPGTGKTALADVISKTTHKPFFKLNATSASVKEIRKIGSTAEKNEESIVMFIDEVHRFSKTQQDVLLPFVETGTVVFIGATTQNPFHSLCSALISRSHIFEFKPLQYKDCIILIAKAVEYYRSKKIDASFTQEAIDHIIKVSCGDGRKVLNTIEFAIACSENVTLEIATEVAPSKYHIFDSRGDEHYDLASAYQGSIQASDADAAVYWLAKWLESGEDPRYIARRLLVSASEDAATTPEAAIVAHNAWVAACEIGRPECDIILAHATILTAEAPRNKRAAKAIWNAVKDVKNKENLEVPDNMKDSHYPGAAKLGRGSYHDGAVQSAYIGIRRRYVKDS